MIKRHMRPDENINSYYVTFGQTHIHKVKGRIFDKDCVAVIRSQSEASARRRAFQLFGRQWCRMFDNLLDVGLGYYKRGLIDA